MTPPEPRDFFKFPKGEPPKLVVVVDVEEEFDWSKPFSREETAVTNVNEIWRAQEIFDKHGVVPTYVVDYPVATTPSSIEVLKSILEKHHCEIGAQLHPWVNPPFDEEINSQNSFPGNLRRELEFEKLKTLTEVIQSNLNTAPLIYRAGRYGRGPNTIEILTELGYQADVSIVPYTNFSQAGGPDYSQVGPDLVWNGDSGILSIPLTCGFSGALSNYGKKIFSVIGGRLGEKVKLTSIAARTGLLNRVRLTPEGMSFQEMCTVCKELQWAGQNVFHLSFHSSSLAIGKTEYVASENERDIFLKKLDDFLAFFKTNIGQQTRMSSLIQSAQKTRTSIESKIPKEPISVSEPVSYLNSDLFEDMIWIVGLPRSGTSWVGKILDSHPTTLYRHEPDTEVKAGDYLALLPSNPDIEQRSAAFQYLNEILDIRTDRVIGKLPIFRKAYYNTITYTFRRSSIYIAKILDKLGITRNLPEFIGKEMQREVRLVWKSINASGSISTYSSFAPTSRVLHIIRHPCGHVASVLRGEADQKFEDLTPTGEDYGIYQLLAQSKQAKNHNLSLNSFLEMLPIERITWRWVLLNEKVNEELSQSENYTQLIYEDLCANPVECAKNIFDALHLNWSKQTEDFLIESTGGDNSDYYSIQKDPLIAANKWKSQLSHEDTKRILSVAQKSKVGRMFQSNDRSKEDNKQSGATLIQPDHHRVI